MSGFARVMMMGNLTNDPGLIYTDSGTPVCKFSLAINRPRKNSAGELKDRVSFINCVTFNKTAENINKFLAKGRRLMVEGELSQRTWTAQDGSKRSSVEVLVGQFHFVDSKPKEDEVSPADETPPDEPEAEVAPAVDDDVPE